MHTETIPIRCVAMGQSGEWQAICLDFDLAVQGDSFEEVYSSLNEVVVGYIETVMSYPPEERERFLRRKAPFWLRAKYTMVYLFASLFGRPSSATI